MSEFIVKTADMWKHCGEELPPVGQTVEVLCTMITRASIVSLEPTQQWKQDQDVSEAVTEVKLWREIDEQRVCEVESPKDPEAV